MASFSGYPQNVTFATVNVSTGGGSENLLINPRGKINQANEADGILSAGAYFCDGWKAGATGAEVYIDTDGFRLISGSIIQLVPNNLEAGRTLRANMDVISGAPSISINGAGDNAQSNNAEYIQFEVSGNNSKFTRLILAESVSLPIYQQLDDELSPCHRFLFVSQRTLDIATGQLNEGVAWARGVASAGFPVMHKVPAISLTVRAGTNLVISSTTKDGFSVSNGTGLSNSVAGIKGFTADARP